MNICEYGCGQEAKHQFKNGKWCCSSNPSKCPVIIKKTNNSQKLIPIETTELCSYGCGNIAKFKLKNGKLCCNNNISKCQISRKKNKVNQKLTPIKTTELCSYGCGQVAKFKLKNGKLCCSKNIASCSAMRKKNSNGQKLIPIETTELCSYGCGQIAKYKLKNGKLCCNNNISKCPSIAKIVSKGLMGNRKLDPIKTTELCKYSCGQVAKYKFKNGELCCSETWGSCPVNRKKNSKSQQGKHIGGVLIETYKICDFGCGKIAKYKFKNRKLCCEPNISQCSAIQKRNSETNKIKQSGKNNGMYGKKQSLESKIKNRNSNIKKWKDEKSIFNSSEYRKKLSVNSKLTQIKTIELCSYGCGQIAKYKLRNGNLCCSEKLNQCPIINKNIKDGKILIPIETIELCSYGCGQIAKYKLKNGKLCCEDNIMKCPSFKLTIKQIKERYPTFYKVEELRYNPEKPNENEIQVRCKYNKCKNSKELNGWFVPTLSQIQQRINCIEKSRGYGESNFYCSNECKEQCILFNLHSDPLKDTTKPYTLTEINIWRQEVFKRQRKEFNIDYNFCEMCNSRENLQVHHEKPQKTHPGMTLDPDNGIILCKKCHYKYGHKTGTECSTGNLANYNPCN